MKPKKGDYKVGYGKPPRRFKPGAEWDGNREGGRAHDPMKRALRKLTTEELHTIITMLLDYSVRDLKRVARNTKERAMVRWIAKVIEDGMGMGRRKNEVSFEILNRLLDRTIGPVGSKVELTGSNGGPIQSNHVQSFLALTPAQRREELENLRREREKLGED